MPENSPNLFPEDLASTARALFGSPLATVLRPLFTIFPQADQPEMAAPELALLRPAELEVCRSYRLAKRRNEHGSGRICAHLAVADYLAQGEAMATATNEIEILRGPDGRPTLSGSPLTCLPLPQISIAHSHGYAAALAAGCPCGIDLQQANETLLRVRDRFIVSQEELLLGEVLSKADRIAALALLWSAKEAVQKTLSYWRMPGFLDLVVSSAAPAGAESIALTVTNNRATVDHSPEQLRVLAGRFGEYGLALCLSDRDDHHA
ncbi:MAG: 4'-phosphopantetheinyl transferase superfamily protein [Desulforhopalus sp.]|jgi:4'-phosphopantetheinyl transferase EntD|nr:4'-phosphopantetheinyl transferase superfamily protein [Desulforhopalus sp.]